MPTAHPKTWHFPGGLILPDRKALSTHTPLQSTPLSTHLYLPLRQHIGAAATPVVTMGDYVYREQLLARCEDPLGAHLHAPTSGWIEGQVEMAVPHPSGLRAPGLILQADGLHQRTPSPLLPIENPFNQPNARLRERMREAGIVGLGGAGFPTDRKNHPPEGLVIDTLIVNGAECEPYISCDDLLMRTQPEAILQGARLIRHLLGAARILVGIEDNKPQALAAMHQARTQWPTEHIDIITIPTRYPAGGERQLIYTLTGRMVPSGRLPAHSGVGCHNVGTLAAIAQAVYAGQPLISRIVTVSGHGVRQPGNFQVAIGTPVSALIAAAGGYRERAPRLIQGGPMMGFALAHDQLPIIKTSNCILVPGKEELGHPRPAQACIRCGACQPVCPAQLLPQQLYWFAKAQDFAALEDYHLFDCIECGCCAYVCPSHIPLVQYYRFAKHSIRTQQQERRSAAEARQRYEHRQQRLQREAQLKAQRRAKRKTPTPKPSPPASKASDNAHSDAH
ncbi:electron transport complex subunit RsxC [Thiorhodospira sibirica]|uniref:electron transport complex subunit RsxC n=1 Tax=Thiorhodospira sibirica TaxID=154347 RepID=UPI00131F15F9|nr:electron transport complex subunit RsxC [Thiorhodospira sibirica]